MNIPDVMEVKRKERRIREYLGNRGYDAMILLRPDNFSWYSCGGSNIVLTSLEKGAACLVITKNQTYAIAHVMDGPRIFDEELKGLDIEPVFIKWHEGSLEDKAVQMTRGMKAVSDFDSDAENVVFALKDIYALHFPLTEKELDKYRWLGAKTEEIISKVAAEIKPGLTTEYDIDGMLSYEYRRNGMMTEVLLVGSDERIALYRHPCPSGKKIDKLVLLHPSARKWGLHANVTRMVYFGDEVPTDMAYRYETACMMEAQAVSMCIPGQSFVGMLEERKKLLAKAGFADEWENHFPGGITGYFLIDVSICDSPDNLVVPCQAYDWFMTITGVKVEELCMNTPKGREIPSITGKWPTKEHTYNGQKFRLPEILLR